MHFPTVLATLTLALGVAAIPQGDPPSGGEGAGVHQNSHQGHGGKACCISKSKVEADGILSGLLAKGLLQGVLGATDQACAKTELIENLNILGFTKQGTNGNCADDARPATCGKKDCKFDD